MSSPMRLQGFSTMESLPSVLNHFHKDLKENPASALEQHGRNPLNPAGVFAGNE